MWLAASRLADSIHPEVSTLLIIPWTLNKENGLASVAPAILFDLIAGGLLTLGLYRRSRQHYAQMPLTQLIIRDGLLYFAVIFASNVAWLVVPVFGYYGHSSVILCPYYHVFGQKLTDPFLQLLSYFVPMEM